MTSEVVLMNNMAVAVAADSLVTITVGGQPSKTYTGVNKLFEPVKGRPIALTFYNAADIMGAPWKSVVNSYSAQSRKAKFGSVEEYANDFLESIFRDKQLFSDDNQSHHYVGILEALIYQVAVQAKDLRDKQNLPVNQSYNLAIGRIFDYVTLTSQDEERPDLSCFPRNFGATLRKDYAQEIDQTIGVFLSNHDLSEAAVTKMEALATLVITKDVFSYFHSNTGLVFCGYGDKQIVPEICSYYVSGAIGGYFRYRKDIFSKLSNENPSIIQPFAQDRMIQTLLTGIDPELMAILVEQTVELVPNLLDHVLSRIPNLTQEQVAGALSALQDDEVFEILNEFFRSLNEHRYKNHMGPVQSSIRFMPEKELAKTAETFVILNSFQQQVSLKMETVGGEVDVALLTPQGFKWVQHQEYKKMVALTPSDGPTFPRKRKSWSGDKL